MSPKAFRIYVKSPEWTLEILTMIRGILRRAGSGFPEHLADQIAAALGNSKTRFRIMNQLLRLADMAPREHELRHIRMIDGQLLYEAGSCVVWGDDLFEPPEGFVVAYEFPARMIGGRPCWVVRSSASGEERVVWAGRRGALYPRGSISDLIDCGGVPCYAVNYLDGNDVRVGFVVLDETEGKRYESTDHLIAASGQPAYAAYERRRYAFVWGTEEICVGQHVGRPVVHDGLPYVDVRREGDERLYDLWRGRERLVEGAHTVHGFAIVRGQIAFAYAPAGEKHSVVSIAGEERTIPEIDRLWVKSPRGNNAFCAFVCWGGGLYADHVKLSDVRFQSNGISFSEDDVTLRARVEGEREARTFNLKELGVL